LNKFTYRSKTPKITYRQVYRQQRVNIAYGLGNRRGKQPNRVQSRKKIIALEMILIIRLKVLFLFYFGQ
jgi:hypothetical protein